RNLLRTLDAQRLHIFEKSRNVFGRVLPDRNLGLGGIANDLVIHVGDVHDVANRDAGKLEKTAQHIYLEKGAEIADVPIVVDCGSAGVHAESFSVARKQIVKFSRQGVEKPEGHRVRLGALLVSRCHSAAERLIHCSSEGEERKLATNSAPQASYKIDPPFSLSSSNRRILRS